MLNVHRFLGPNFASVRTAVSCGWIASDDAHGHVVLPVTPASSDCSDHVEASRLRYIGAHPNRPLQGTVEAGETFIGGKAARSAFAALAHLPTQPCTEHRRDGNVRVPTIGFDLLYVLAIIRLGRRQLVWIKVTPNPTAEGIAPQNTEAFPWNEAPRYLIRDRD